MLVDHSRYSLLVTRYSMSHSLLRNAVMPLVIRCPHCTKAMQIADDSAGKQFRCPSCMKPFTVGPAPAVPTERPACKAVLLPGAIACMDCGYLIQGDASGVEMEGAPNLCPNPACGVANPPGERNCQRCSTPLPTAPGTMLHGRYRIERLLAIGGFGAVYLASDTKHGNRLVAIKDMICADKQEFTIRLNFFRREDLLKIMEQSGNKPFPIDLVVEWGKSVCDVLTHMHNQSPPLVHRDVKP